MHEVVVVGMARTPMGRFNGGFASLSAVQLGGHAIAGALARGGVDAGGVDYVVMGHVLQAGQGQITARQAAVAAGIAYDVPAETINKVCLSGMTALSRARDLIRVGDAEVVVAGGMESMSTAPYVLDKARFGYRMGDGTLTDVMLHDGLTCAFDHCAMGLATETFQRDKGLGITREQQDAWSARSHARAAAAWEAEAFDAEVVPVEVPQRRGEPVQVTRDEGIRPDTTEASLAGLRPAFDRDGTITAGNASQISDGAAALVLASREVAERQGLQVLATLTAWGTVAGPDTSLHLQPAAAIEVAAARTGAAPGGFDLYEINEAFASVAIASTRALGVDEDRVNVHGGAVALGHPIGCSGARIVVSLIAALRQRGGGTGAAALCGGGGQGDALTLEV
ncbi:MAG: acetyl-CoA C-acyltransferase [Nitriliruptoraceae bacterium]